jgi:hypothetical protein
MTPAPPPFRQISTKQLEVRSGGCLSLVGIPVLILGIFTTLVALGILPAKDTSRTPTSFVIGLAFVGIGMVLAFGRYRIIFDAGQGRLMRRWSVIIPIRHEERNLNEFTAVSIAVDSNSDSADSYPVRLKARTGKELKICTSNKYGESRERAEFLAGFLRLDLEDRSSDHALVVSTEQASETLQERLRSGGKAEPVARPLTMRSQVEESGDCARIVIPGRRWAAFPFAIGALIPLSVGVSLIPAFTRFFHRTETPDTAQIVLLAFLMLVFGLVPLVGSIYLVVSGIRSKTMVSTSRTGILIDRLGIWRTKTTSIPAEDIIALDYSDLDSAIAARAAELRGETRGAAPFRASDSPIFAVLKTWASKGIVVKSRHGLLRFGEGLTSEELRYLQSVITRALIGSRH